MSQRTIRTIIDQQDMVSARDALGPELEAFVYELLRQEQVENILA